MSANNGGYTRLEFSIPSRGLIGYRGEFMTDTKGNGIMNYHLRRLRSLQGRYPVTVNRVPSSLSRAARPLPTVFLTLRTAVPSSSSRATKVYAGMVIGQSGKPEDIELNVCKTKHLTNTRSSGSDEALKLTPPKIMSLEQCLEFIDSDELLEVTPKSLRIRKKILDSMQRKRASFKNKNA